MPHLVLAGAGHAHLDTLANLREYRRRGHRVTVVSPEPFHAYTGMGPGVLGGLYPPEQALLPVERLTLAGGGSFRTDRVSAIDSARRLLVLASGDQLPFDILSCNLGDGSAVLHHAGLVAAGHWVMHCKAWLDQRFVTRYQRT